MSQTSIQEWDHIEVEKTSWGGPNAWFKCMKNRYDPIRFDTILEAQIYIAQRKEASPRNDCKYRIVEIFKREKYTYV